MDRLGEHRHRTVGRRVVVTGSRAGQMRNLNVDVGNERQKLLQKDARLSGTVGALLRDRRAKVHDDRHVVVVCRSKDLLQPFDVLGVVQLYVRVAEMELDSVAETRTARAAVQLFERVLLERIEAAECSQPIRKLPRLRGGPVVLGADLRVLVIERCVPGCRTCRRRTRGWRFESRPNRGGSRGRAPRFLAGHWV